MEFKQRMLFYFNQQSHQMNSFFIFETQDFQISYNI